MSVTQVDGAYIKDNAIDSDHYLDGSIDTAHLGNNQVDGTKLGIGTTQGDVLVYNGTDWIRLGHDNGKFLRSNGGSSNPSWETVSGVTLSGSTSDTVATVTGANALIGEANLTFNGTDLDLNATAPKVIIETTGTGGNTGLQIRSAADGSPDLDIRITQGDGSGSDGNMFWLIGYCGTNDRFRINSGDINGSGAGADVMRIEDGTDDVAFLGGVGIGASTAPTAGLNLNNNVLSNVGAAGNDWNLCGVSVVSSTACTTLYVQVENENGSVNAHAAVNVTVACSGGDARHMVRQSGGGNQFAFGLDRSTYKAVIGFGGTFGTTDAMRISGEDPPVITLNTNHGSNFDYVCEKCGRHSHEMFVCCGVVQWHDDQLVVKNYLAGSDDAWHQLVKLGIFEYNYDDVDPATGEYATVDKSGEKWRGWNPWVSQQFTWAMVGQERIRSEFYFDRTMTILEWHEGRLNEDSLLLDSVLPDHEARIKALEAKLEANSG